MLKINADAASIRCMRDTKVNEVKSVGKWGVPVPNGQAALPIEDEVAEIADRHEDFLFERFRIEQPQRSVLAVAAGEIDVGCP